MAFSVTLKSPMKRAERISRSLGVFAGQITISSFATTLIECTSVTRYFKPITNTDATAALFPKGIVSMVIEPISELGFCWKWDSTTGAFDCYYPTNIVISGSATGGAATVLLTENKIAVASTSGNITAVGIQALANDAVGTVNFVAIGFI